MFYRSLLLVVVTVSVVACGQGREEFPTAGAPGSMGKIKPDSPAAKGMDAAKQAGRLNARPGRN